ncbi:hypothetical protein XELAEV_18029053mg [Xenopus laevis]|uniref:Uncharacterized protein n=1 Tax=Xenopus laevis TaxID=8355 RepID=A0A974CSN1_XENLA|nr:hypothetical protein XELAEV_18029053mg [Xenopus laevis]
MTYIAMHIDSLHSLSPAEAKITAAMLIYMFYYMTLVMYTTTALKGQAHFSSCSSATNNPTKLISAVLCVQTSSEPINTIEHSLLNFSFAFTEQSCSNECSFHEFKVPLCFVGKE